MPPIKPLSRRKHQYASAAHNSDFFDFERQLQMLSNSDHNDQLQNLIEIVALVSGDERFNKKYIPKSLFPIASGAFGHVFRMVTRVLGSHENNVQYPESFVHQLRQLKRVNKNSKISLRDPHRNEDYLDVVAVKVENLSPNDVLDNSSGKINLVREYLILRELFMKSDTSYSMVGFPIPIEFGFLGQNKLSHDLKNVRVVDIYGSQSNYSDSFVDPLKNDLGIKSYQVTDKSYMTLELMGPSLQEWSEYYKTVTGYSGDISFTVRTTLKLMDQVLCRLIVMHRKGYLHLDLKPDNICMGIGETINTIYLLDYGLSKKCSSEQPDLTVGSKRYMSLGVIDYKPANFMMDIESWFYVLTMFLCGYLPWTEDAVKEKLKMDNASCNDDKLEILTVQTKRDFWSSTYASAPHLNAVRAMLKLKKADEVQDIVEIYMLIYNHVKRMLIEFYPVSHEKMQADICDEESALFKRYLRLRKLLLHVYNIDFRGGRFAKDKELIKLQETRMQPKLTYVVNGKDWQWDWDM